MNLDNPSNIELRNFVITYLYTASFIQKNYVQCLESLILINSSFKILVNQHSLNYLKETVQIESTLLAEYH